MRNKGYSRAAWLTLSTLLAVAACAGRATDLTAIGNDSESHFLVQCEFGGCGDGLSCVLGVCTATCSADADCSRLQAGAVCRGKAESDTALLLERPPACDVACSQDADCTALGIMFRCDGGFCRAPLAELSGSFARACTQDSQCAAGLDCIDNACSQRCEDASDCDFPGASCPRYLTSDGTSALGTCVYACEPSPLGLHDQCAFLGDGGRCTNGYTCGETFSGQCGDVGQPGGQWSCYEDIAADVFRARRSSLEAEQLCVLASNGRVGSFEYRRCADGACADGQPGCPVSGLVLESQQMPLEPQNQTDVQPVLSARAEVQLREPLRMTFELADPVERCEYTVAARFWNLYLFDGYTFLSAETASYSRSAPTEALAASPISSEAIDGGYWQAVRRFELGHEDSSTPGVTIEDSEADVRLLSGGERCTVIQGHVGVTARDELRSAINAALNRWSTSLGDTLDCTPCGRRDCELACRYR